MVYFLSASGDGIERYAETDQGVMDVPRPVPQWGVQFAEPEKVHPDALEAGKSVREQGYWVKPETMPKQYLWANGSKPLPNVLPGMVVCERFKDLVEEFEPGVHQFVPVEIYKSRSGEAVATYYWFIVGQRLDSVDRKRTTYAWEGAEDWSQGYWVDSILDTSTWQTTKITGAKLRFDPAKIDGHSIWHDPHVLGQNNPLCSEAVSDALRTAGFVGLAITPRERD